MSVLISERSGTRISQVKLVLPANDGMVGPRWRHLAFRRAPVIAVLYEHLPSIVVTLKCVQIKGKKVVEEITFHLTPEDIYL